MSESLRDYLDFAVETAYLAGRLTLGYYQTGVELELKGDDTPVTAADRQAEELIRRRIEKRYPRHAIVGEELGEQDGGDGSFRWFIDPIDGTKAFVAGVPLYAVLLGLEIEGQVRVGVVYFPALEEVLYAASGEGCWWNGRRARVSSVSRLQEALVAFGELAGFDRHGRAEEWKRIQAATRSQRGWGDAYGYALVATGRAEVALDPAMCVWDSAPYPPIFEEAGGYFGDWQGNPTIHVPEAMATSQVLLPQLLEVIRRDGGR